MKEQLVSFETAKLAKELRFDWSTYNYFWSDLLRSKQIKNSSKCDILHTQELFIDYLFDEDEEQEYKIYTISQPTQSLLQKWLREVHKLHILIIPFSTFGLNNTYHYEICGATHIERNAPFSSYEECLEEALLESLKWIKNEKN